MQKYDILSCVTTHMHTHIASLAIHVRITLLNFVDNCELLLFAPLNN